MTNSPRSPTQGYSAKSIRNGLVAGYAAGTCGIVVGHPLDSIKVLLQTNGGNVVSKRIASTASSKAQLQHASNDISITRAAIPSTSTTSSSSGTANMSTIAAEQPSRSALNNSTFGKRSLRALYAGVTGPLLTAGLLRSLDFAIYDSVRRTLYRRQLRSENTNQFITSNHHDDYLHYDNLSNVAAASFVTGSITSVITSPLAVIKTKQQIMVWGFRKAAMETYHSGAENGRTSLFGGIKHFYTGFGLHFFCFAFGGSVYFTSYEMCKRFFAQRKQNPCEIDLFNNQVPTSNLSLAERMISAATAGTSCWCVIFPADVIRSRLYAQSLASNSSSMHVSGFELAKQLVQEQGWRSLYRGMGVTVARAGPVAAAVLPVYDSVLSWLNS